MHPVSLLDASRKPVYTLCGFSWLKTMNRNSIFPRLVCLSHVSEETNKTYTTLYDFTLRIIFSNQEDLFKAGLSNFDR